MHNPGTLALTAAHLLLLLLGTSAAPPNDRITVDFSSPPNTTNLTMVGDKAPAALPPNLPIVASKTDNKSSIPAPSPSPPSQAVLKLESKKMNSTPATSVNASNISGEGVKTAGDASAVSPGKNSTGTIVQLPQIEDTGVGARVEGETGSETKAGEAEAGVAGNEAKAGEAVVVGSVIKTGGAEAGVAGSDTNTGEAGKPAVGEKEVAKPPSQPQQNTTRDDNPPKVPAPPLQSPTSSLSPVKTQEKAPPATTSTTTTPTPVDKDMDIRPPETENVGAEDEEEEDKDEDRLDPMLDWPDEQNRDSLPSLLPQAGPGGGGGGGGEMTEGGQFRDDEGSHFFAYFLTVMVTAIIFYLVFHNKQRIMALIIEGRAPNSRRRRRNSSRARYTRLDNTLEEAITATRSDKSDHRAL